MLRRYSFEPTDVPYRPPDGGLAMTGREALAFYVSLTGMALIATAWLWA